MAAGKNKFRILVAGQGDKLSAFLSELLPKSDFSVAAVCASAGQARRTVLESDIDLVIINAPLGDEFGTQLALDLADGNLGVVLMVPGDVYDPVCCKVEDLGVLTLPKPVSRDSFYRAVRLAGALRSKLLRMEKKHQALEVKMRDIRTVNQAKWLLIEHLRMSESDAHYFIEKQAMDSRLSRREVAENIIKSYQ